MLAHLVLLKTRPDLTPAKRRAFVAALEQAVAEIPSVRGVRVGRRVRHGAAYEGEMPDAADFMAVIDFDDVEGLRAYLTHRAHQTLGQELGDVLGSALVYDFEVGGIDVLEMVVSDPPQPLSATAANPKLRTELTSGV